MNRHLKIKIDLLHVKKPEAMFGSTAPHSPPKKKELKGLSALRDSALRTGLLHPN
jgi:hypothetical protein